MTRKRTDATRAYDRMAKRKRQELARQDPVGLAAAGMRGEIRTIPPEEIEARRIWERVPDTRTITGYIMGDPVPARSALAQRGQA